ncbi:MULTISPECIES: sulfate adenylyltransferase subunit 1 [unclassified Luteococcus]|uniref:sulfate adenylyltransferase subunit 1 n=1 Tax=unclassified Luteococcus TaxID=2639923 RepID=UPI00313DBB5D
MTTHAITAAEPVEAPRQDRGPLAKAQGSLLRLATAGSVDDGKSTLVGRLLYDSKSILADQLDAVERVSQERGLTGADLALLTDGLRAEREQGITIDVAYRYFATAERTFILADCPGHVQYTRNTVTGASTADVLVLLVDVRRGVLEQTRRHLAVAALLRVPHVVVAVNKLDLVDFSQDRYTQVATDIVAVAQELGVAALTTIPVSALDGDNVVDRSQRTPWYDGPSLLDLLVTIEPEAGREQQPLRFPVQYVLRPQQAAISPEYVEYRGYAGQVAQGTVRVGDQVVVLPSGRRTCVVGIDTATGSLDQATVGESVSLRLADEIDITRGELIAAAEDAPTPVQEIDAMVAWLADTPLRVGQRVLLKHGTRTVQAIVRDLEGRLDLDSMTPEPVEHLELNDIGRVRLKLAGPVMAESYQTSRPGGAFLLVDAQQGLTLAAGMVDDPNTPGIVHPPSAFNWSI